MGFPERPTKSAFIARFNNNHFGVLYKKTDDGGFQIVFDGADEQKAQEVARTLGKQYCPPPAQPCEENADDEVCEVHEVHEAEREAEREAKRDAEAQQQKQREEEDAREEMLEQKHNDEAEIKEPDAHSEENHSHSSECGEPVLFFRSGRVFRIGCEKHMRTWAMGPGTLAYQRAHVLDFELNEAKTVQSVQEAMKRWENQTAVSKIQECINEIRTATPTKAADFEWPKTGKKARYGFDQLPKNLWLYGAVIKE